jgi:hypothetical protein
LGRSTGAFGSTTVDAVVTSVNAALTESVIGTEASLADVAVDEMVAGRVIAAPSA